MVVVVSVEVIVAAFSIIMNVIKISDYITVSLGVIVVDVEVVIATIFYSPSMLYADYLFYFLFYDNRHCVIKVIVIVSACQYVCHY